MDDSKKLAMIDVSRKLGVSYGQVFAAVARGSVPAERTASGRWRFNEADMPAIARGLFTRPATPPTLTGLTDRAKSRGLR